MNGPPTCPEIPSLTSVENSKEQPSVYPYPSKIGAQNAIFKKSNTFGSIGAEPVAIFFTLPPNTFLTLLNTNAS